MLTQLMIMRIILNVIMRIICNKNDNENYSQFIAIENHSQQNDNENRSQKLKCY